MYAAYVCQSHSLRLKPWQEPPCWADEDERHPQDRDAQRLLRRMLKAGVSRYHPDPLAALAGPSMRFVPIKTKEQQTGLMLHRSRQLLVRQRTMLSNAIRGHMAEFGIISAKAATARPSY